MSDEAPLDYFEERFSAPAIVLFFAVNLPLFIAAFMQRTSIAYWLVSFALFFALASIYSVRLALDEQMLKLSYGVGIFSTTIDIFGIQSVRIGPNERFWAWMFSALSPNVVVLTLREGPETSIPTANPNKLVEVLRLRARISQ